MWRTLSVGTNSGALMFLRESDPNGLIDVAFSVNNTPPLSTVTLSQLRMLFQSTHEDRHGAEAPAEPGNGLLSNRYSAPLRPTSWVIGPSTRGHSRTSV